MKINSINATTLFNILSSVVLQGMVFLTTPIFSRMLGTEQYGDFSVYYAWVGIFSCVMGLGVTSTLANGKYQFKEKYKEFRSCILLLGTLISLVIVAIMYGLREYLAPMLKMSSKAYVFLLVTCFSQMIISYVQSIFIYEKKALNNLILSVCLAFSSAILSIILIKNYRGKDIFMGRVYGIMIPYLICAIILWIIVYFDKPVKLNKVYCKFGICVGFPIVFHMLSHNILTQSDRVMMQWMGVGKDEIGVYSLYYMLSSALAVILNALNTAWCPFYYDSLDERDWDTLNKRCRNYIEIFTVLTSGFILVAREVAYYMASEEYQYGVKIIPLLAIAVYFTFMYQFPANYEFFHKKTKIIAIGTVIAGIVNIICNLITIPIWGMYGAALATVLSYLLLFLLHYFVVTCMFKEKYHLTIIKFVPGLLFIFGCTIVFYGMKNMFYLRWLMALFLGGFEIYRMKIRKGFF